MSAPISVTKVHQPYLNENISARQKKLIIMDGERMNDELIGYIMRNILMRQNVKFWGTFRTWLTDAEDNGSCI